MLPIEMAPGSFDPLTAREVVGDERSRVLEARAREDAEGGNFDPPELRDGTYWEQVMDEMMFQVYAEQYRKRLARLQRKRYDAG